jgi:hypothetical protein
MAYRGKALQLDRRVHLQATGAGTAGDTRYRMTIAESSVHRVFRDDKCSVQHDASARH